MRYKRAVKIIITVTISSRVAERFRTTSILSFTGEHLPTESKDFGKINVPFSTTPSGLDKQWRLVLSIVVGAKLKTYGSIKIQSTSLQIALYIHHGDHMDSISVYIQ